MFKNRAIIFHKTILTTFITSVLMSSPVSVVADTYVWGDLNSIADSSECNLAPDAASIAFTMLQPDGIPLANNSNPDLFSQAQTSTCGTVTYDTVTESGTAEIIGFDFFSSGLAVARNISIDRLPDALDQTGNGDFFLVNMLFDWNTNNGIPVSIVWDAQGILGEMDGTPTSYTLNNDGSINTASAFSSTGAIPASDGILTPFWTQDNPPAIGGTLGQGPVPIATTMFNTANVSGIDGDGNTICVAGADSDYSNNLGGGCMNVAPSADIAQAIIVDLFDNSANNPTQPVGVGGNPMVDGPFTSFNANFDINNMKLVSFTDTTAPVISLTAHVTPAGTSVVDLIVNVDTYTEPGATCEDAPPLEGHAYTVAAPTGGPVDTSTVGSTVLTYTCTDASGNSSSTTRTVNVKAPDAVITLQADGNGDVSPVTQECTVAYVDAGASCTDPDDGLIVGTDKPLVGNLFSLDQSNVDANIGNPGGGPYTATWSCRDSDLNSTAQDRSVNVVDTTVPVITPNAGNGVVEDIVSSTVDNPAIYNDQGAVATDTCDIIFPINIPVATIGTVTMTVPDTGPELITSNLQYTQADAGGNSTTAILTVNVTRAQPVITLVGSAGIVLDIGDSYVEEGMDVIDAQDGDLTGVTSTGACGAMTCTVDASAVDTNTTGSYTVTYDVVDSFLNNATQVTRTVQVGAFASGSNFTMLNPTGSTFGGTNDVVFEWDESLNTSASDTNFNMGIFSATPTPFNSAVWIAHDIRAFGGPGTYYFETDNAVCTLAVIRTTGCPGTPGSPTSLEMIVGPGQVGAHILFDWNGVLNIDVVNVWDIDAVWDDFGDTAPRNAIFLGPGGSPPDVNEPWKLMSTSQYTDTNGPVHASPMIDGPFIGFYANFNAGPGGLGEALPPITSEAPDTSLGASSISAWFVFTGFFSLLGLRITTRKRGK